METLFLLEPAEAECQSHQYTWCIKLKTGAFEKNMHKPHGFKKHSNIIDYLNCSCGTK